MLDRSQLLQELAQLLTTQLKLRVPPSDIQEHEAIFGGRLQLDSVDAAQWVLSVERQFGIQLADDDLLNGALNSIGALADVLIRAKIQSKM